MTATVRRSYRAFCEECGWEDATTFGHRDLLRAELRARQHNVDIHTGDVLALEAVERRVARLRPDPARD